MKSRSRAPDHLFVLPLATIVLCGFLTALAPASPLLNEAKADGTPRGSTAVDLSESKELPGKRSRYSNTYLNADGTYTSRISASPVNYLSGSDWLPVKDDFVKSDEPGFSWRNEGNEFDFQAASSTAKDPFISFAVRQSRVTFSLVEAKTVSSEAAVRPKASLGKLDAPSGKAGKITYEKAFEGTDIVYTLEREGVKEEIVLSNKGAPNSYLFRIDSPGLTFEKDSSGRMVFRDDENKPVFFCPKPYMTDAKGRRSYLVGTTIIDKKGKRYLRLTAGPKWLNARNRAYPVRIDPTDLVYQPCADAMVYQGSPATNYGGVVNLKIGKTSNYLFRSFIKFDLGSIPFDALALRAVVGLGLKQDSPEKAPAIDMIYRRVAEGWSEDTITWNNQPSYIAGNDPYIPVASSSTVAEQQQDPRNTMYRWAGCTRMAQKWISGDLPNYGLVVFSNPTTNDAKVFYSREAGSPYPPMLEVVWKPHGEVLNPSPTDYAWTSANPRLTFTYSDNDPVPTCPSSFSPLEFPLRQYSFQIFKPGQEAPVQSYRQDGIVQSGSAISYNPAPLVDGTYYWRVTIENGWTLDGNVMIGSEIPNGTSLTHNFTSSDQYFRVDATAPARPILDQPVSPTNNTSVYLSGSAEANSTVTIYDFSGYLNPPLTTTADSAGHFSVRLTLSRGGYNLYAQATDSVGNAGPLSEMKNLVIDTVPPSTPAPDDGISGATNATAPTFSWPASTDDSSGVSEYRYLVRYPNGGHSNEYRLDATTYTLQASADGTYTIDVIAIDRAGNRSQAGSHSVTVDTTPPTIGGLGSPAAAASMNSRTVEFSWDKASDVSGIASYIMYIAKNDAFRDADCLVNGRNLGTATSFSWFATADDKDLYWKVKVIDGAGNVSWSPCRTFTIDTTPPAVSLTSPRLDANHRFDTNRSPVSLRGLVSDGGAGAETVYVNGQEVSLYPYPQFSTSFDPVHGDNPVSVSAKDRAGNISAPLNFTIRYDTTPPTLSELLPQGVLSDAKPTLSCFLADTHTGVNLSRFSLLLDGVSDLSKAVQSSPTGFGLPPRNWSTG